MGALEDVIFGREEVLHMREASMPQASDPATYTDADIRLAAVDMDGTLWMIGKLPRGIGAALDSMEARGVTFAPASGRQIWTLINMFPGRLGMTFIGEMARLLCVMGKRYPQAPLT